MLKAVCRHSPRSLAISLRRTQKAGAHCCAPALFRLSGYGLELTDECGTAMGPSDCSSSERPMHWPELAPVHGMLSTSGSPPDCRCLAWLRRIRHEIRSALTGEGVLGFTAGARRYRRRRVCRYGDDGDRRRGCDSDRKSAGKYQSSCWKLQGRHHHAFCSCLANRSSREKVWRAASPLHALYEFPADGSSEVVAAEAIC